MHVVHVLGLAHSGTTILDRILSCYPGVIGLGEVEQIWKKVRHRTTDGAVCPCGAKPNECIFWKQVLAGENRSPDDFFRAVVETASQQHYRMLVDTSKALVGSLHYSNLLQEGVVSQLTLLRLVRDPRGWVHSMMRREKIELSDSTVIRALFYRWLFTSLKLDRRVHRPGAAKIYVWYDRLILRREEDGLATLLGLEHSSSDELDLATANQHAMAGNKFVFSQKRSAKLTYDDRWLETKQIEDIYADMTFVRAYYHEAQKLHLRVNGGFTRLPRMELDYRELQRAISNADFRLLDDALENFSVAAKIPQDVAAA
jgi:hypothetical protein